MKKSLLVLLAVVFVTAASSLSARCCETKCAPKACCEKVCKPCEKVCKPELGCKPCEVFFSGNHCRGEEPNCTGGTCTNIRNKSEGTYNTGRARTERFDDVRAQEARTRG